MIDAFRVNDNDPGQILALLAEIEGKDRKNKCINIVAIDEIQFFKPPNKVVEVVERLVDEGRVVIAAGLPTDFRDQVFGAMPELIAKADKAIQMTALCTHMENGVYCGKPATKSQRFVDGQPAKWDEPIEVVGGKEMYAARCREHYFLEKPQ
jgi:thymidine kinase